MDEITAVKFVKQYTTINGNVIMRFASGDRSIEIVTREGRYSVPQFTRAEAKAIATVHFLDLCGRMCPVTTHFSREWW